MTISALPSSHSSTPADPGDWDTVIGASGPSAHSSLREVWRYRDLLLLLVRRDFVALHKQTVLGSLWFLIQPVFTAVAFWFVFAQVANLSTDGLPPILFYMAGVTCWTYFGNCIRGGSTTFRENAGLFGKIYFPRPIVPLALVASHGLRFAIQLVLLLLMIGYFAATGAPVRQSVWILALPLLIVLMTALGLGIGLFVAAVTTKYRDLELVLGPGVQLMMFVTPVAYPLSAVGGLTGRLMSLNPMTPVIEGFRMGLLGQGSVDPASLALAAAISVAVLLIGSTIFARASRTFVDTI